MSFYSVWFFDTHFVFKLNIMNSGTSYLQFSGYAPSDKEQKVLHDFFGEPSCKRDFWHKFFDLYALPIISTLIALILLAFFFSEQVTAEIPSIGYRVFAFGILFFILVFLADRIVTNWRQDNKICRYT